MLVEVASGNRIHSEHMQYQCCEKMLLFVELILELLPTALVRMGGLFVGAEKIFIPVWLMFGTRHGPLVDAD